MQLWVFTIPMDGDPDTIEELKALSRGREVVSFRQACLNSFNRGSRDLSPMRGLP